MSDAGGPCDHLPREPERPAADAGAGRRMVARGVFFIVGAPRSGTTLLQAMLCAHRAFVVPPETELFMRVPDVSGAALQQAFAAYRDSRAFKEQEIDGDGLARLIGTGEIAGRAELLLEILRRHGERAGRPRVGEKSPHHCRHVRAIAAALPQARFIHLLRDARDVVASRLATPWSEPYAWAHAKSWARIVRDHEQLMRSMPPERYTQVRFESLVREPEAECRRLCAFLDEEFDPAMLRFHERAHAGFDARESAWKGNTLNPLDGSAIGRYREKLTPRQVWEVQLFAARQMRGLGYALEGVRGKAAWWAGLAREVVERRVRKASRT